ncbi:AI-2E family transporter [uncultured Parasphingorhabdus sp.]|uniref:AI-2E family transporter n=1 Tax=uncultured Parasphingorhabdus sp. TaxID=2709694 RepID=UPI0030D998DF|tara:strand:+ start:86032 stop:87123 length:1092 start_codon:yes stop_codon:yes gene_type:complete
MNNPDASKKRVEWGFLITLLVIVSLAFAVLVEPFFGAIVWGVVVAVLFRPVYERLLGYLPGRTNLAAVITLVLILLLVVVPTILLGMALAQEAASLYVRVQDGDIDFGTVFEAFERSLPHWMQVQLAAYGYNDFAAIRAEIEQSISAILEFLVTRSLSVGQGAFQFLLSLGVMMYLTFFLLRDGRVLAERIDQIIPLSEENGQILKEKFLVVIRATIKGSLIIAIIQGSLGGLVFWALDIRGALLWAVLMGIFSLIPAIGTGFVWLPVALFLFITGDVWQGVVLILCGVFVISMVDNLVRPTLVGRDTRMPDYVVLISTLGGLQLFGINGIVIGPLVAALFIALWSIFSDMQQGQAEPEKAVE